MRCICLYARFYVVEFLSIGLDLCMGWAHRLEKQTVELGRGREMFVPQQLCECCFMAEVAGYIKE